MLRLKGDKHIELMFDAGTSDTEFVDWVCCAQSSMGVDAAAVTVCHQYAVSFFAASHNIRLLYWRDASHNTLDYCIGRMHLTIH